jgi:hypothetical protein
MTSHPVWSSNRRLVATTGAMLLLAVPGCARDDPPCFDGTYEVEFLERLPASDCPEAWATGWRFTVESVGASSIPQAICRTCGLKIIGDPPPRAVGDAGGSVYPYPVLEAGLVSPVDGDSTACEATNHLAAYIPNTGYANVAEAAADDAMVWRVAIGGITSECDVIVPESGGCTDYYRSRMTKIADWTPE